MRKSRSQTVAYPVMIGALAFVLRAWNTLSIGKDFYASFLSDASTYRVWAGKLVASSSYGEPVFQMGPLYPYFLALNLGLGIGFYSVLFVQALFGALVTVMVYLVARKVFGNTQGLISGLLTALYAPFIFYDGILLSESLQIFLMAGALSLAIVSNKRFARIALCLAGVLVGLAALGRATILFFPLALVIFWSATYLRSRKKTQTDSPVKIAILLVGIVIGILPATLHNMSYGDLVFISSNTGINFYIGNNASSTGSYDEPQGLNLSTDFTGRGIAEKEAGRQLRSSGVSSFWMAKTMGDIRSNPFRFLLGLVKKTWLYLWYFDISQAESLEIQHLFSPLFRLPLVGFGFIFVFGLLGLLHGEWDDKRWLLILLLISNIAGVALFFVIGRFKLIGSLALLAAAGSGIVILARGLAERKWPDLAAPAAIAVAAIAVLYLPRPLDKQEKLASAYDNVGIFYHYKGQSEESIKWYRRAADLAPSYPQSLNNIGTYFYSKGLCDSAAYYFHRSLAFDSTGDKTLMNLGRIAVDQGKLDTARYYYERAKTVAPFGTTADEALQELEQIRSSGTTAGPSGTLKSFDALFDGAERFSASGQFDQAERLYTEALKIKPDDIRALNNLGFAYQAQKKYEAAARNFERVLNLSPGNAVAYNNLAGTVYQMGLLDSAQTLWEKAIRLDPANEQIKTNLEYLRRQRGR